MAVMIQSGSGKEFNIDDSQVEFWESRGFTVKAQPRKAAAKKPTEKK